MHEQDHRTTAAGIAQLEGYLLVQAETAAARAAAEDFADRLPWLTTAQREDVVRLYVSERMALSRRVLGSLAHRCRELRSEYDDRYAQLRRRLLCRAVALALVVLVVSAGCGGLLAVR